MSRIVRVLFVLASMCEASAALGLEVRTAEADGGVVTVGRDERIDDSLIALAVGLAVVLIAVSLPWIGGLLNIVATALGFGVLLRYLWNRWNRDSAAVAAG